MVKQLFLPLEAKAILKLLLSVRLPQDVSFWTLTKDGPYTVKTGYYLIVVKPRSFLYALWVYLVFPQNVRRIAQTKCVLI